MGSTVKGYRVDRILSKVQNHLLNERVRQVHFTIEALKEKADHFLQRVKSLLPVAVLERIIDFIKKAELPQHTKSKERQIRKFQNLQLKSKNSSQSEILNWRQKTDYSTQEETLNRWVKNLSARELTHKEKEVLTKGLIFAVTPQQVPIIELIATTESAIRKNNLTETETEQLRLKVSATLSSGKAPPPNLTAQERIAMKSPSRDKNITILCR